MRGESLYRAKLLCRISICHSNSAFDIRIRKHLVTFLNVLKNFQMRILKHLLIPWHQH